MGCGAVGGAVAAAAAGAAVSAGASALTSKSGGSGGSSSGTATSQPWAPQGQQLADAYSEANGLYNTRIAAGPYTGNFVAGPNATQNQSVSNAGSWANGTGAALPGQVASTSSGLMGAANPYVANASAMASNGTPGPNAGVMNNLNSYASGNGMAGVQGMNQGLSSALNNAATTGANAIGGYNAGLSGVMGSAQQDSTAGIISDAGQYVNSSPTQSSIDNVNRQIDQTLNEQTNPGMNRQAAAGGNLNSSRAGAAEAMNNENAAIAKGNADSQITNNAYNTGVATAASQHTAGLNTALSAAEGGLAGNTALAQGNQNTQLATQLGEANSQNQAANTALGQQNAANSLNANTQLNANAQLGTAAGMGINGAASATNDATANFGLGQAAGQQQQTFDQNALNNSYQQWQMGNTYNQNVLNDFMGVVGSGNWGGSSASAQQSQLPANLAGNALGGAAVGAGLYKNSQATPTSSSRPSLGTSISNMFTGNGGQQVQGAGDGLYGPVDPNANPYASSPNYSGF